MGLKGLFFYNKRGSIIPTVVLPTTEIIESRKTCRKQSLQVFLFYKEISVFSNTFCASETIVSMISLHGRISFIIPAI